MSMQKHYTDPKICPLNPAQKDMMKEWYVHFRWYDAIGEKWKQFRYKKGINEYHNYRERLAEANGLRQALKEKLRDGWDPLTKIKQNVVIIYSAGEAIDYILNIKSPVLSPKSKYAYKYITKNFKDWLTANNMVNGPVKKITDIHAQNYMDNLLLTKNYSGRTFNDHLIVLRTFFNLIKKKKWIDDNPFHAVDMQRETVGRNHAYTDTERKLLEDELYLNDRRLYFLTQFIYHCFFRRPEIVSIKIHHIDVFNRTIIVPGRNAKNRSQESVVIPDGLMEVIKEMELHKFSPDSYLFGRRLLTCAVQYKNPNWISTRHSEFVRKLKFDSEKGLYSWKHTGVCNYYYATNKDIYSIMRQLRHRDLNTTMIYLKSLGLIQNDVFRKARVA